MDAVFTFRETNRYFARGSKVFSESLDANKAFDHILYYGLYLKLLYKGVRVNYFDTGIA